MSPTFKLGMAFLTPPSFVCRIPSLPGFSYRLSNRGCVRSRFSICSYLSITYKEPVSTAAHT